MRHIVLWVLLVIPGLAGIVIFGFYALQDWAALQEAYRHYIQVAQGSSSMPALFIAESAQNIHRVNLFADGVWALQSAVLGAVGVHGLCVLKSTR